MLEQVQDLATATSSAKHLFQLRDGTGLVYSLPWNTKPFYITYDYQIAWDHTRKNKNKERALKIHGWEIRRGSSLNALFADFDELPDNFDSWDSFYQYVTSLLEDRAIVFRSYSGKVKALFLVDMKGQGKMTLQKATSILAQELPSNLFNICDQTLGGLSLCFLNLESLLSLSKNLISLEPIVPELSVESDNPRSKAITSYRTFDVLYSNTREKREDLTSGQYNQEMIENLISEFQLKSNSALQTKFILFAFATPGLLKGFCISQELLGGTLGISRKRAGRFLKKMIKASLIEETKPYIKNYRPATYRAKNELLEALRCLYGDYRPPVLPTSIPDREWNDNIIHFGLRCFRHNPYGLVKWIKTIPGFDKKDRLQQAEKFAEWMLRVFGGERER